MKTLLLLSAAIFLVGASDDPKALPMLAENEVDIALILPPPPAEGSMEAIDERAELHRIDAARTAEEFSAANSDEVTKDVTIFAQVLGTKFDVARLPKTAALFDQIRVDEKMAAKRAKKFFARNRPWIGDAALKPCTTDEEPTSSYPSGHATMGYSFAVVLARLIPSQAQPIMARAARYGRARLVCEMHFRSDVAAGEALGVIVSERLMAKPAFRTMYDAAAKELRTAGIR
jgi:acid phosphatase (class A)